MYRPGGGVREYDIGEAGPVRGLRLGSSAAGRGPQAGHAGQPAVRPGPVIDFPYSGVVFLPALRDRPGGDLSRPPAARFQPVVPGRGGEQQQRLTQGIELELAVHPVADQVESAGVPGQVEPALVGHPAAVDGVGRGHCGAVGVQPAGDKADGAVEQRVGARGGRGLAGVALITDPGVPVVVVAALLRPLGQAGRGRRDHAAAGTGQAAQHQVSLPGVAGGDAPFKRRRLAGPLGVRGVPECARVGRLRRQGRAGELEHEVAGLPGRHGQAHRQAGLLACPVYLRPGHLPGPAQKQLARPARPGAVVVAAERAQAMLAEPGPRIQRDIDVRRTFAGDDLAEDHDAV
jgi:hypothetical protein